jgi:peptide/nickel transport system substrate-binding protein
MALGEGATTDSLDPATYPDSFTGTVGWGSIGNGLTEVDASGQIVPDLAESMEPSDRASTWVFKLRKDLTFHNGKTVTSADVIESYRHHMNPASRSAAKSLLETIVDIRADGPETVVFTLSSGSADFPYLTSDYHLPIMPAREGGGVDWESGIRTGPFILRGFDPGVAATMKRNPNYHRDGPWFDDVEILVVQDVAARMNALITGEVDYAQRCDLKTLDLLRKHPGIEILEVTGNGHYTLPMNVTVPPFDNADVRAALKYAIDREDIQQKVFLGHGTVGNDNPIAPTIKYAVDPKPVHSYDPEKSKFHLKRAGLESLKVELSAADAAFADAVDVGLLYREHAARAGIDINVVRESNDGYWDNVWLKKPWVASYWFGRATCDWMFTTAYAGDAAWNETFWNHPRFDELLLAARAEFDEENRAGMYAELQQLIHDDGGAIVLLFNSDVSAHSTRLSHAEVASNWVVDGLKLPARWWFT